jgi:hypothetical protein
MKSFIKTVSILSFIFLFLWLIIGLLLIVCLISYPYKELSESLQGADSGMIEYNIIFYFFLTILIIALGYRLKKKNIFLITKNTKKIIIFYAALWFLTLTSPFYYGYFVNIDNIVIRADYRIQQDKWEQGINIYKEVERYMDFPNKEILKIQTLLNEVGYYNYKINGRPDNKIIKQLKKLQSDYGLGTVGFFGPKSKTIVYGIKYKEILKIDPVNSSLTEIEQAVVEFQMKNEIQSTGLINEETLELLKTTTN